MAGRSHRYQRSKRAKIDHEVFGEDRISQLPSCILICILSSLTLDEAARTSVLSKYWRELWKFTARLDFDGSILLRNQEILSLSKGRQRIKYISWVNKVLKSMKSNKAMGLDEFRLSFELFGSTEKAINKWLNYAFERRVQRLDLDFTILDCPLMSTNDFGAYRFPRLLDQNTKELSEDPDSHCKSIHTLAITDFDFLRSLSLSYVTVLGEQLEFILRKFPFLEHLKVCGNLVGSLKVCGPSLALKYLEITHCSNLESILVRDTCIVSLKVSWELDLVLENNPKLVEVWVCASMVYEICPQMLSCLGGVEVVTLSFPSYCHGQDGANLIEFPRLTKVKQLILVVEKVYNDGYIHLLSLIGLFPNLEKFVLKVNNISSIFKNYNDFGKPSILLKDLQVFELHGYSGCASEDDVVMHVVENAAALQSISIKLFEFNRLQFPHSLFGKCCSWEFPEDYMGAIHYERFPHDPFDRCKGKSVVVEKIRDNARVRAHHLKGGIPSSIGVVIL